MNHRVLSNVSYMFFGSLAIFSFAIGSLSALIWAMTALAVALYNGEMAESQITSRSYRNFAVFEFIALGVLGLFAAVLNTPTMYSYVLIALVFGIFFDFQSVKQTTEKDEDDL